MLTAVSRGRETTKLHMPKPKQKTDLYVSLEKVIGRHTATEKRFGLASSKIEQKTGSKRAAQPIWQLKTDCPGSLFRTYPTLIRALSC